MQKLSKIKMNLFMNSFQDVPSEVACSKLGSFTVSTNICCYLQDLQTYLFSATLDNLIFQTHH